MLLILKDRRNVPTTFVGAGFPTPRTEIREAPYTKKDIAERLNRSEKSVSKSLRRLYTHDKIERYEWGWRLKR